MQGVQANYEPGVESNFNLLGGLPKGSALRALDSEIANEGAKVIGDGQKVILSNGEQVAWTAPPEKIPMPDLSNVKSLRHYFGQKAYQPYPAWLYHENGKSKLVKDHKEAAELGIVFREATRDEQNRYGIKRMWDWEEDCKWRPTPWTEPKFDPKNPGLGKEMKLSAPDPRIAQHSLVAELVPAVMEAVMRGIGGNKPSAPANIDSSQWEEFLAFQAWKKSQEVVDTIANEVVLEDVVEPLSDEEVSQNALLPEQERVLWEAAAERQGIKVDKRWGLERLKAEVNKAA